jgi:hypothetical protein
MFPSGLTFLFQDWRAPAGIPVNPTLPVVILTSNNTASVTFSKTSVTGSHASGVRPGVDVSQIAVMTGPRYTYHTSRWTNRWLGDRHRTSIFGETLFGGVYAFDGAFPTSTSIKSSATALSMQFGGGLDVRFANASTCAPSKSITSALVLPNSTTDSQHDLRLAIGVTYRLYR